MNSYAISEVTVTNIRMPFMSMVWFMVKWSIAVIPAMIILTTLFVGLPMMFFGGALAAIQAFAEWLAAGR